MEEVRSFGYLCPKCGKPTRVGHEGTGKDKKRVCKKCGAKFE